MVKLHLDQDIKNRIAELRQSKLTYKQIFDILRKENVTTSLSAVKRIGQRFQIEDSVKRKSGSGRPRASTFKDNHRLKIIVLKDRKKTYVSHSKEFKTADEKSLSRMTIFRRMKAMGFSSKRCAKKPLLSKKNINDRKTFSTYYGKKMQNGSGMFSGQMNQDFVFLVMLPNAAFEDPEKDFRQIT